MADKFAVWDAVALIAPILQGRERSWYSYPADFVNVAGATTTSQDIKISDDADFIVVEQMAVVYATATPETLVAAKPFLASIKDAGSGRDLTSAPVHLLNLFGSGENPFVLPQPQLMMRASTYTISLTNLTAATAYTARLAISGFKVYGPRLSGSGWATPQYQTTGFPGV